MTRSAESDKPNIIVLLVDDMGYGDIAAHGNQVIQTPNFDRLHDESLRFERFCVSPTCAPTRAAIMTGMHEFAVDVSHTTDGRNVMSLTSTTVAEILRDAGYATGMFGKWHLGTETPHRPENRGFDTALTCIGDTQQHHYDPTLLRNGREESHTGYRTDILFREAIRFIERHREEPFFCYIPTYSPHTPLVVPDQWSDLYPNQEQKHFLGMVTNVDHNLGRLRTRLEELGIARNTVLIAMNDNGGTWGVDLFNGGMRGRKSHTLYGGIRAYSLWCWPTHWQPGVRNETTGHVDVLPTLAALAGADLSEVNQHARLDGLSLMSLLEPEGQWETPSFDTRMLIHHRARWSGLANFSASELIERHKYAYCCVRWNQYLLMRVEPCDEEHCVSCQQIRTRCLPGGPSRPYTNNPEHYVSPNPGVWQLYDIDQDLFQEFDIASAHPNVVRAMSETYEAWWVSVWRRT